MELTSEDAALLRIASENVHLKLKRERDGVHEINQSRGRYGEYHHLFPQLKADGERFFQYFRKYEKLGKKQVALIMLIIALQFDVSTSFNM